MLYMPNLELIDRRLAYPERCSWRLYTLHIRRLKSLVERTDLVCPSDSRKELSQYSRHLTGSKSVQLAVS